MLIDGKVYSEIGPGLVVLLGIEHDDGPSDVAWISSKICQMRLFGDDKGLMNLSLLDTGGDVMLVSQFTLYASAQKGNRPSFIRAARPDKAQPLYEEAINEIEKRLGRKIATGRFGANMQVALTNDGPVTILIDSSQAL